MAAKTEREMDMQQLIVNKLFTPAIHNRTALVLTTSFQINLGKLLPECQTILDFAASRDVGGGGGDTRTARHGKLQ